jgi:hypothetical protein
LKESQVVAIFNRWRAGEFFFLMLNWTKVSRVIATKDLQQFIIDLLFIINVNVCCTLSPGFSKLKEYLEDLGMNLVCSYNLYLKMANIGRNML